MKVVIYISIAVLFFSCKARKQIETTETIVSSDSVVYIERTTIDTVKFPADTIYQSYPISVFIHDTVIEYRKGRASSIIQSNSGVLSVTTKCDSLEKLVLSTQTELKELTRVNSTKEVRESKTKEIPWWYKASFWLVLIAIVFLVIKRVIKTYLIPI